MEMRLAVENVKCGGCARSIQKALIADPRIERVCVDSETGVVVVESDADVRAHVAAVLARLGYPERGRPHQRLHESKPLIAGSAD